MRVRDVYVDGHWNFTLLYTSLPSVVIDRLQVLPICLSPSILDCVTWKGNRNGIYPAQDGYYWLNINDFGEFATAYPRPRKAKILHLDCSPQFSSYEIDVMSSWHMLRSNLCPRCNQHAEIILHCLRDCEFATIFWKSIGFVDHLFYQGDDLYIWLRQGTFGTTIFLFLVACWWLWRGRNKFFANELLSSFTIRHATFNYTQLLSKCFLK
jgi:hypothetical protein